MGPGVGLIGGAGAGPLNTHESCFRTQDFQRARWTRRVFARWLGRCSSGHWCTGEASVRRGRDVRRCSRRPAVPRSAPAVFQKMAGGCLASSIHRRHSQTPTPARPGAVERRTRRRRSQWRAGRWIEQLIACRVACSCARQACSGVSAHARGRAAAEERGACCPYQTHADPRRGDGL